MLAPGPHTFTEHLQDPKAENSLQKLVPLGGGVNKQTQPWRRIQLPDFVILYLAILSSIFPYRLEGLMLEVEGQATLSVCKGDLAE